MVDGEQVLLGMSLGIALVPNDGTDSRSIPRSAAEILRTSAETDTFEFLSNSTQCGSQLWGFSS